VLGVGVSGRLGLRLGPAAADVRDVVAGGGASVRGGEVNVLHSVVDGSVTHVSCLISPATDGAAPVTPRAVPRDPAKSHPPDARLGTADDSHPARDDDNNNKIKK